jgi:hypothetical protein
METNLQYVKRKLNDPKLNISAMERETKISRYLLNQIANGNDAKCSLVDLLYVYFKKISE